MEGRLGEVRRRALEVGAKADALEAANRGEESLDSLRERLRRLKEENERRKAETEAGEESKSPPSSHTVLQ